MNDVVLWLVEFSFFGIQELPFHFLIPQSTAAAADDADDDDDGGAGGDDA